MNPLRIEPTSNTPDVVFRPAEAALLFEGDCYPEDPARWFGPVFTALSAWLAARPAALRVTFRLRYVNSASTKALRRLFVLLDRAGQAGTHVGVAWEHDPEDDVSQELGEHLAEELHFLDLEIRADGAAAA